MARVGERHLQIEYLHNIGDIYGNVHVTLGGALLTDPGTRVDYVLTNTPFGKKFSITFANEEGRQEDEDLVYNRQDFWTASSNKQLNKDKSLADLDNLPAPDVPADEIMENLQSALASFQELKEQLR